jgi:hypothetical protein
VPLERDGKEMRVHLQAAGIGLADRVFQMCEDSDLHARTESGWMGICAARSGAKGLLSAARVAGIMTIVSSASVAMA